MLLCKSYAIACIGIMPGRAQMIFLKNYLNISSNLPYQAPKNCRLLQLCYPVLVFKRFLQLEIIDQIFFHFYPVGICTYLKKMIKSLFSSFKLSRGTLLKYTVKLCQKIVNLCIILSCIKTYLVFGTGLSPGSTIKIKDVFCFQKHTR